MKAGNESEEHSVVRPRWQDDDLMPLELCKMCRHMRMSRGY